jgi:hypothetical protein
MQTLKKKRCIKCALKSVRDFFLQIRLNNVWIVVTLAFLLSFYKVQMNANILCGHRLSIKKFVFALCSVKQNEKKKEKVEAVFIFCSDAFHVVFLLRFFFLQNVYGKG